jgi:hypothetical protein
MQNLITISGKLTLIALTASTFSLVGGKDFQYLLKATENSAVQLHDTNEIMK